MEEMELYHVHSKTIYDSKYTINNIMNIDNNYNSIMNKRHNSFNQLIKVQDTNDLKTINFFEFIASFLDETNNMTSLTPYDLEMIKNIILNSYHQTFNAYFFLREEALENYRKDYYNNLPSRLHSMYLCDQNSLEYWLNILSENGKNEVEVYKVLASGNIFKTNEQLLPDPKSNFQETYNLASNYWNPDFTKVPDFTNEYLVQGQVKILEKIK